MVSRDTKKIKGLLFDMDGVLLDSMPMHKLIWSKIFAKYNLRFNDEIYDKYNGTNTPNICKRLVREHNLNVLPEDLSQEKKDMEPKYQDEMLHVFPHVEETINELHRRGYRLAIATASEDHMVSYLKGRFDYFNLFDTVVQASMVENIKPAPDIFMLASEKLGLKYEECAVIEDAPNGIIAANSAGNLSIGITHTTTKEALSRADMIINHLGDLLEIFK